MPWIAYGRFEINPIPYQLSNGSWRASAVVREADGDWNEMNVCTDAKRVFDTNEQAEKFAVWYAKDVIDGKIPDLSLV